MARLSGSGGGGRSPSYTKNPMQKGYNGPSMVGSQINKPTSKKSSGSGGGVSPLIGVPVLGGFDQMRRNSDAIKSALGGRVSRKSAPKRKPTTAKSQKTGGGGKSTPKREQRIGTPSTGKPARSAANKLRSARGKRGSLARKLELRGAYGKRTLRERAVANVRRRTKRR